MTLTQITYFEAVCEHKNVTKAANALFVSRTAVSRALKDLENEWNLVLFKRSRTGVELTEDGEMIRNMFSEFNKAYTTLKNCMNDARHSNKQQELRIGITTTTGSRFFPAFFNDFKQNHPNIKLRIYERPSLEGVEAVLSGDCDFFITPNLNPSNPSYNQIGSRMIYRGEMILCVSKDNELADRKNISRAEVSNIERASLLTPLTLDVLDEDFLGTILPSIEDEKIVLRSSQHQLIQEAVACDFTSIVIPREIASKWDDVAMIPFDPPHKFPVYIIWNKNTQYVSEAFKTFLSYVYEYDFNSF